MPGVIDEFLLGVKMEGDPSGLVEAYKKIFDLQEEYNRREREREEQEQQDSENESKRGQGLMKIKKGVSAAASKGVGVLKQGVSIARGWAVALLAVDGAAMAVVGRLSQMAVEYQNVAGATGTSAEAMKAWEDTFKDAGGKADDVQSSLKQLYEGARNFMYNQADDAFVQAMGDFNVRIADESGNMRDTADVFADIITSARRLIEGGADRSFVLTRLAGAGVSENLIEPLLAKNKEGAYRASPETYQKYLGRAQGMDELADASREISSSLTNLSSVIRSKFTAVLLELVDSGVLTKMLNRITEFVESIDEDDIKKIASLVDSLIEGLGKVVDFISFFIPGTESHEEYKQSVSRKDVLLDALKENLGLIGYGKFQLEARGKYSPGSYAVTEEEAILKAQQIGLNVNQIYGQAGLSVNNNIQVLIDGKDIPSRTQETQRTTGASGYGGVQEQ